MRKDKISKQFKPTNCMYRLGRRTYLRQPKNTYIRYYIQMDGGYIAILGRHVYILPIVALIVVCLTSYYKISEKSVNSVKYTSSMHMSNNKLSLDVLNTTDDIISVSVLINGKAIYTNTVKSGESLSNVECNENLATGSYSAYLVVAYKDAVKTESVLIRVE